MFLTIPPCPWVSVIVISIASTARSPDHPKVDGSELRLAWWSARYFCSTLTTQQAAGEVLL